MAINMPILEVKNVTKRFGAKVIVSQLNFEVNPGEVVGFLGPNGAGKTTAIKMILGLLSIDSGEISINGFDVKANREQALQRVGGIIESPELYGYLSGMANLKLFASMYDGIKQEQINGAVKTVRLENRINDKVKKYSLGMRQRLGVAQAILHTPNLLILDEPTNGLDPNGIKELRSNLRTIAKSGAGVLVSSHQLAEMELMCDRVIIIENGVITSTFTVADIQKQTNEAALDYMIETDNTEEATKIFEANNTPFTLENGFIKFSADKTAAAQLAKQLIDGGLNLYAMQYAHKSLEDAFLEITDNNTIR